MRVTVQLFAVAKELAGRPSIELELSPNATVADLRQALAGQVPALAGILGQLKFAVNHEYATDDRAIPPHAQVACIPPVSGG